MKDRVRTVLYSLPYVVPPCLLPDLVNWCARGMNLVTNTVSFPDTPRELLTGERIQLDRDALLTFGMPVLAKAPKTTNNSSMKSKADHGVILGPEANNPRGYRVYLPSTRQVVSRSQVQITPWVPGTWGWKQNTNFVPLTQDKPTVTLSPDDIPTPVNVPIQRRSNRKQEEEYIYDNDSETDEPDGTVIDGDDHSDPPSNEDSENENYWNEDEEEKEDEDEDEPPPLAEESDDEDEMYWKNPGNLNS